MKFWFCLLFAFALILPVNAQNEFVRRYATTTTGAMVMTGNTLGLSKTAGVLRPGTNHSIGVYTSIDQTDEVAFWPKATYGPTTTDYTQNGSTARFLMPSGSKIRYAELIWGGTLVSTNAGQTLTEADVNIPVTFSKVSDANATVSLSTQAFSPDVSTRSVVSSSASRRYYVRSANVTSFIRQNGTGFYACQGVRSTLDPVDDSSNSAGWTLAVIYENDALPARNLTLFVGASLVNSSSSPVNVVRGFCTAPFGASNLQSRLALSAIEGDASLTGDQFQFGSTASLTSSNAVQNGNANRLNNFFEGQINTGYDGSNLQNGTLETTGTAGTRNHTTGVPGAQLTGGRQGWDITNFDVSAQMQPNQTAAYFRGTSAGDEYTITSAALQLDIGAPRFPINVKQVDKTVTYVGDTLTYTVRLDNSTGTADAKNVTFFDEVPSGTSFIAGSFRVDGVTRTGANPATGVPVGNISMGSSRVVSFQVRVNTVPPAPATASFKNIARWTYEFQSCSFESAAFEQLATNEVETVAVRLEPSKTVTGPNPSPQPGDILTWTLSIPNTGTANSLGATLVDPIGTGLQYVPGSTRVNGTSIADGAGATFPFETTRAINSSGDPSGVIAAGKTATVTFQTVVQAGAPSRVTNIARVDADGTGPQPEQSFGVSLPAIASDLAVAITDNKTVVSAGTNNTYTVTISNNGPQAVGTFNLFLDIAPLFKNVVITPSRGTYNAQSGDWSKGGGADLLVGNTITFTITGIVDSIATDPIVLRANVTTPTGITDTNASNNSAIDSDTVDRVADLQIEKTDNRDTVSRGNSIAYALTVTNLGPTTLSELTITDPLPSAVINASYVPSQGSYNSTTGLLTAIDLAVGEKLTLTITGQVSATASGVITNTGTVSVPSDVVDPVSGNNSATDTSNVGYSVAGTIYLDNNSNFEQDANETGYNGQSATAPLWVKIRTASGNALAAAQVGSDGRYLLTYPTTDNYTLFLDTNGTLSDRTTTLPDGYLITETGSAPGERAVALNSNIIDQDFGLNSGSTLSGVVFRDNGAPSGIANNGTRESNEIGVGGVKIQLRSGNGQTLYAETFTDTTGAYSLVVPAVAAGTPIQIVKTNPGEWISTGASRGTLPSTGYSYTRATDTLVATPAATTSYTGVDFGIVPENTLSNDGAKIAPFGGSVLYPHAFTAQSGGAVTFSIVNTGSPSTTGWSAVLYNDTNGNGEINANETPISSALTVVAGQTINLLVKVFAPADGPENATLNTRLDAAFVYTNATPALSATISRGDLTTLAAQPGLLLTKAVDKATAKSGEIIAYEIAYRNTSSVPLSNIIVNDTTPAFTKFLDVSFDALPLNLTGCTVTNPAVGAKGPIKWVFAGTLAPGQSGKVRFRVTIE